MSTRSMLAQCGSVCGQIPYLLAAQGGMMIGPASLTDAAFGTSLKPVGAGPYKVRVFEAAQKTVTDRFDCYWGGTEGRPASMEHHFVPDSSARLNAFRPGCIQNLTPYLPTGSDRIRVGAGCK